MEIMQHKKWIRSKKENGVKIFFWSYQTLHLPGPPILVMVFRPIISNIAALIMVMASIRGLPLGPPGPGRSVTGATTPQDEVDYP